MKKNRFMEEALEIAFDKMGSTSPNPPVGAVIAKDGQILSRGGTSSYGSHHAEVMAIKNIQDSSKPFNLEGAEIFVTLEPCNHFGKTPPCTEAIINSGICRVYIPILDPNPIVAGKGVERLKEAGVEVVMLDEYSKAAEEIIYPFVKLITRELPFVIHKTAITMDGRSASKSGDSKWISSNESRLIVHKLRAKMDAIIIGKNTFENDKPRLDVRMDSFSEKEYDINPIFDINENYVIRSLIEKDVKEYKNPLRVVIGIPNDMDSNNNFFFDDNYLFFIKRANLKNINFDINKINHISYDDMDSNSFINFILIELKNRGVMTILLEGGNRLVGSFFDAGEIDQYLYFIAPKIIGNGMPSINGTGFDLMSDSVKLKNFSRVLLKDDILINGYK